MTLQTRTKLVIASVFAFGVHPAAHACDAVATVGTLSVPLSAFERKMPDEDTWRPIVPGAYLCHSERVRVSQPGASMTIHLLVGGSTIDVSSGSGIVALEGDSIRVPKNQSLLTKILGVVLPKANEYSNSVIAWRDAGDRFGFVMPDLAAGTAKLAAEAYDGRISLAWHGGFGPFNVQLVNAEAPADPIVIAPPFTPESADDLVSVFTLDAGPLPTGTYSVTVRDDLGAEITGSFALVSGQRPRFIETPADDLPLNLQAVLDSMYVGLESRDAWALQGLQVFHADYPDVPMTSLRQSYLLSVLTPSTPAVSD